MLPCKKLVKGMTAMAGGTATRSTKPSTDGGFRDHEKAESQQHAAQHDRIQQQTRQYRTPQPLAGPESIAAHSHGGQGHDQRRGRQDQGFGPGGALPQQ